MNQSNQTTIIIGAGFTGLFAALHMRCKNYKPSITLIDSQDRFVFKPMLFDALTSELAENTVCPSYQELLQNTKINFIKDRVIDVDLNQKQITLASGDQYLYDQLVLSVGSVQGYMNTPGTPENVFPFRTREDMLRLKSQIQSCLSSAIENKDEQSRLAMLTFAIVGAGPTGVEMAATLADLLPTWYAKLGGNIQEIKVFLINRAQTILSGDANAALKDVALAALKDRIIPVDLLLGAKVKGVYKDRLEHQGIDSEQIQSLKTQTVIWTAGTAAHPLIQLISKQIPAEHLNKHGLPFVSQTLQLLDYPEVFAAGDCVEVQQQAQPALAQIAYQQGTTIAQNLDALEDGRDLANCQAKLRGTLMKLGSGYSAANILDKFKIEGKSADIIRHATYIEMLPTPIHNFKATKQWLQNETVNLFNSSCFLAKEENE
ncbi:MAG: NAD(P)/FAD-dependent oxidoreductase [Cyanobacteriota bacterium ELA615]